MPLLLSVSVMVSAMCAQPRKKRQMIGSKHIFAYGRNHTLWMPLYAEQCSRRVDKRLHRCVRCKGNSFQSVCDAFDNLVMVAVDRGIAAELCGKPTGAVDGVTAVGVTDYMLLQGPAEKHIDSLHSAADAKHGLAAGKKAIK